MSHSRQGERAQHPSVESTKPKLKRPAKYRVCLLNDDYTPMDFVVNVLEHFFSMEHNKAVQVMLQVHNKGKAICGVYTRDVAETKVTQVSEYSRIHQHPLLCTMEAE